MVDALLVLLANGETLDSRPPLVLSVQQAYSTQALPRLGGDEGD